MSLFVLRNAVEGQMKLYMLFEEILNFVVIKKPKTIETKQYAVLVAYMYLNLYILHKIFLRDSGGSSLNYKARR